MSTVHPLPPLPAIPVRIARLDAIVLRCPIETPVRTSFGTMRDRPAVFVRIEDDDGAVGWGETWCNFPACGAEHRAQLLETVIAPLAVGQRFASPVAAFDALSRATAVLAIQSGEQGPLAQSIAGLDLALWGLCARRRREPLWRLLGGSGDRVEVYASGINPDRPEAVVAARRSAGYRAFKLKVGFDDARDLANVAALRSSSAPDAALMVDANQGWSLEQAQRRARAFERIGSAGSRSRCAPTGRQRSGRRSPLRRGCRSPPARICSAARPSTRRSRRAATPSSSPTSRSGAASPAAGR